MSEQSAFDRQKVENSAYARPDGLLEQLNLPSNMIVFIRSNQRILWTVTIFAAVIVITASLYGTYRNYRVNKASSALSEAMNAEEAKQREMLAAVATDYVRTPAWRWSQLEEAHLALDNNDADAAIALFEQIQEKTAKDDPVLPLLLYGLATAKEQKNDLDDALQTLEQLSGFTGFTALAYLAMGRIQERRKSPGEAVRMYREYIAKIDETGIPSPERDMAQARINALAE